MRNILFRGKRADNGEWIVGFLFQTKEHTYIAYTEQYDDDLFLSPKNIFIEVIPETIGQYTGLTDKNGKKIFEGDVVKVERDFWHGENKKEREIFISVVCYDEKSADFGLKGAKYMNLTMHRFKGDYQTVIGNIHDNPELLGGDTE